MGGWMQKHRASFADTVYESRFGAIRRQYRRSRRIQLDEVASRHWLGVIFQPYGRLRSVADPDLAKDRLDVDLHGALRDTHLAGYDLVRTTLADIPQDVFLAARELRIEGGQQLLFRVRFRSGQPHRSLDHRGGVADLRSQFRRHDGLADKPPAQAPR